MTSSSLKCFILDNIKGIKSVFACGQAECRLHSIESAVLCIMANHNMDNLAIVCIKKGT